MQSREQLGSLRPCERCKHDRAQHMDTDPGYAAPCEFPHCGCLGFEDEQQRADAKAVVGQVGKAPAGWVKALAFAALLAFSVGVQAQEAKVIPLSPSDATKAKTLYEAQEAAKKAFADFQAEVAKKYISAPVGEKESNCSGATVAHVKDGWGCGQFWFSDDFKFIVPAADDTPQIRYIIPSGGSWSAPSDDTPTAPQRPRT